MTIEDTEQNFKILDREYAPRALGKRMVPTSEAQDKYERDFIDIIEDTADYPSLKGDSTYMMPYWPQGGPDDRKGMIAVFHPAMTELYDQSAKDAAKKFGRTIHVIKQRDARWVYLFAHNPQGVGDEWIDSDWHYSIDPDGIRRMLSAS